MDKATILAHRLQRQRLARPAQNEREYLDLVHWQQPVAPIHFSMPGLPPRLVHRVAFDDAKLADRLRGWAE